MPCTLNLPTGDHNGLVINLSPGGLFVQTTMPARPGSWVRISLPTPSREDTIALEAKVVWRRRAPRTSPGFALNGMGVEIRTPPKAYAELMMGIAPESLQPSGAGVREVDCTSGPSWIVRLGLSGSPRSKRAIVQAPDEDEAARRALADLADGWCVLDIEPRG